MDSSTTNECLDLTICGTRGPRSSLQLDIGSNKMDIDCFKDLLQVVEWIEKGSSENVQRVPGVSPCPVAVRLENKYKSCIERITDVERKLKKVEEENETLKEKLNAMELLAGHNHSELIRLTAEVEVQKWERFEVETKVRRLVARVKYVNKAIAQLLVDLQYEDSRNCLMIQSSTESSEVKENVYEEESGDICQIFKELATQVKAKLQKCRDMQINTRSEVSILFENLKKMEEEFSLQRKQVEVMEPPRVEIIPSEKVTLLQTLSTETNLETPIIKPVPIKSILMRRSTDGTFEIARNRESEEHEEEEDEHPNKKKKRTSVDEPCLDHQSEDSQQQFLADPLEDKPLEDDSVTDDDKDHFEIQTDRNTGMERFDCSCGKSFLHRKLLDQHLFEKGNGKIFECSVCSQIFVFKDVLEEHMRKSHKIYGDNGTYRCRDCYDQFSGYAQLRQHLRNKHKRH